MRYGYELETRVEVLEGTFEANSWDLHHMEALGMNKGERFEVRYRK